MINRAITVFLFLLFIPNVNSQEPTLNFPHNNAILRDSAVVFVWDSLPGQNEFTFEIYQAVNPFVPFYTEQVFSTSVYFDDLIWGDEYLWRISSDAQWSVMNSFRIFKPTIINGCNLWLSADSNLVLNSNQVEEWGDLSGMNHNASQLTIGSQPSLEYNLNIINNTIRFDGIDDYLILNDEFEVGSMFIFSNWGIDAPSFSGYQGLSSSSVSSKFFFIANQGSSNFYGADISNYYNNNVKINNILSINYSPLNRFKLASASANSILPIDELLIGTDRLIAGRYWNGSISEVLTYNRNLLQEEQDVLFSYFVAKYAPPVNLGVNIFNYGFCDTTLHAGGRFTSYLWSTGETGENITISESGTYWVDVVDIFGFTSSDTIVVTYPQINQPTSQMFCPGEDIVWNANLGADYDYLWSTGETTESITINTEDTYFVTITDTNGCQRVSDALFFEEDPFASIVSLGPDINLCSGNSIALVSGAAETVSYLWGGGETTPSIVVNTTDTYTVEVENANGCVATDDILVTIVGDAPVVQIGMDPSYCQLEELNYFDNSFTTDGSNIIDWSWDLGDATASTDETGSHTYVNHGQVTVQLTVITDAGCENTGDQVVEIFQKPIIDFSTTNVCQSDPINFYSNQSTLPFITNWMWNFDDPASGSENTATGEITAHVFETFGDFDVELMAEDVNGCRDTVVQTVSILPTPQVAFTFNEVCVGQTVNFTNLTTIEDPYLIASTQWQLGGGAISSQFSPSRLYITAGTFNVILTVTANNGCVQQLTQPLKIHAQPQPDYFFSPSCAGLPTVFTDNSVVPDGSVSFVTWQFNANNPVNGDVVSHSFTNPGTQQVRQIVVSDFGCQFTEISNIETNPALSADFSVGSNLILAGTPTVFQNESIGAETYEWEIGGFYSGTDESPELTFPLDNIGDTVSVVLIASNSFGCSDTVRVDLVIYEARTDLAVTQVFTYTNPDGYITLGAELTNMGSSTITQADLYLRMSESSPSKGTWEGELGAGEKEIYLFPVSPYQSAESENINDQYICVEGRIVLPAGLIDEVPANNEFCRNMAEEEAIILIPYPNPVSNELTIRVIMPANQTVDIQIFDAAGKLVYTVVNNGELTKGLNTFTINVNNWSEGSYTIFMQNNGIRKTVRFIRT